MEYHWGDFREIIITLLALLFIVIYPLVEKKIKKRKEDNKNEKKD
jgi:hypothetical protein